MRLEEALQKSSVNAAHCSYYRGGMQPLKDKRIVWRQDKKNGPDVYVVFADTFKFVSLLMPSENDKVQGRSDWEPVAGHYENCLITV
jgi:hypothetical protein